MLKFHKKEEEFYLLIVTRYGTAQRIPIICLK